MNDMNKIAEAFVKQNRGKGRVTKVTDYSFTWETLPDKNGNTHTTIYMLSYFMQFDKED